MKTLRDYIKGKLSGNKRSVKYITKRKTKLFFLDFKLKKILNIKSLIAAFVLILLSPIILTVLSAVFLLINLGFERMEIDGDAHLSINTSQFFNTNAQKLVRQKYLRAIYGYFPLDSFIESQNSAINIARTNALIYDAANDVAKNLFQEEVLPSLSKINAEIDYLRKECENYELKGSGNSVETFFFKEVSRKNCDREMIENISNLVARALDKDLDHFGLNNDARYLLLIQERSNSNYFGGEVTKALELIISNQKTSQINDITDTFKDTALNCGKTQTANDMCIQKNSFSFKDFAENISETGRNTGKSYLAIFSITETENTKADPFPLNYKNIKDINNHITSGNLKYFFVDEKVHNFLDELVFGSTTCQEENCFSDIFTLNQSDEMGQNLIEAIGMRVTFEEELVKRLVILKGKRKKDSLSSKFAIQIDKNVGIGKVLINKGGTKANADYLTKLGKETKTIIVNIGNILDDFEIEISWESKSELDYSSEGFYKLIIDSDNAAEKTLQVELMLPEKLSKVDTINSMVLTQDRSVRYNAKVLTKQILGFSWK